MHNNKGAARLAGVLASAIHQQTARPEEVGLGDLQQDLSLLLDRFQRPIPRGDYLLTSRAATLNPPLGPGDRVVAVWCNDGTDAVIIDRVVSS